MKMWRISTNLARKILISRYNTSSLYFRCDFSSVKNEKQIHSNAKPYQSIPGPNILTIIARFLPGGKYHKVNIVELQHKFKEEYGDVVKLPAMLGKPELLMTFDPNDSELIFRNEGVWPERLTIETFTHYRKKLRPDVFKNTGGLLSEQGESWSKMRTIVNPIMLKPSTVNAYVPGVDEIAIEFCDRIKTLRDHQNELPANFLYELNKWSLESIASIALDQRLHILSGIKGDRDSKASQLIEAVDKFFELSFDLEISPSLWRYVSTPKYKRLMKVFDTMTDVTLHYVDEAVNKLEKNPSHGHNHEPSVLEKLLKIDKHVAVVMALDMFLAGVDTTSASTSNLLYHLAKNPNKQEILRKEIQCLPTDANGKLTPTSFLKASYLRACLKEVMRLAPIVGGTARAVGCDLVIKGFHIPKGTNIVMSNMLMHHDENHFKDSHLFLPERWLKDNIATACPEARASHPFVYLPFGFGPRSCVGKRFAEMEINVLITRILRQFQVEYHYEPLKYRNGFVQSPISDLKFKLTEI